jgi:type I restriction enzyme S subunit
LKLGRLFAEFDRLSEAPGGVNRLRRFILDLAVRGNLTEQDTADEPAEQLIASIDAANAGRRLRPSDAALVLQTIAGHETPFALPESWAWVRLGRLCDYLQRGKSPRYSDDGGPPVVSQKCVRWEGLDLSQARTITEESVASYESARYLRSGDLLWNSTGTGTIGRVTRVVDPPDGLVCDSHVTVVRCPRVSPEYVRCWLRSDHVYGRIEGIASGSTNQVELTLEMALAQVVPVPPLAEQTRIVDKVGELMALCDQLEAAQAERERRRDLLVASSLQRLSDPARDGIERRRDAGFCLSHMPALTMRRDQIVALRGAVLNLAVQGRLVPQDPSEEPARSTLEAVASSRRLAQASVTGRDWVRNADSPAPTFTTPAGWAWARLGSGVERVTVGYVGPMTAHYSESGVPFLRSQNVRANRFRWEGLIRITEDFHNKIRKSALAPGDVVVVRSGNVGTSCVIPAELPEANCSDLVIIKRPMAFIPEYLAAYMNSLAQSYVEEGAVGMTLTHFNTRSVALLPTPVPPLAEQRRIMDKVEELMALCDELEQRLSDAEAKGTQFLEAVLVEALRYDVSAAAELV